MHANESLATAPATAAGGRRLRLVVVDDHTLFRRGLIALLEADGRLQVVAEASDAGQAEQAAREHRPDVVLLDNHLPGASGLSALPSLLAAAPGVRVLLLTMSEDERDLAAALRGGASGYLLKSADITEVGDAVQRAMQGQTSVSAPMTAKLAAAFRSESATPEDADPLAGLSAREREILNLIARGDSNKLIARELDIAESTVKIHVQHILRKLNLSTRLQAALVLTARKKPV
jgi:two-component system, NarL family, nitrate/nitrite response regulator NarL